jgi:hypothetical protein
VERAYALDQADDRLRSAQGTKRSFKMETRKWNRSFEPCRRICEPRKRIRIVANCLWIRAELEQI